MVKKQDLNKISRDRSLWCISKKIHISAAHIPGHVNAEADKLSRNYKDDLEWSLDQSIFQKIQCIYIEMKIDMFSSRLNVKLKDYVSFYPYHGELAIDAFTMNWNSALLYMFPSFSLIPRILQKVQLDQAEVVLVAPVWQTHESGWPHLLKLLCQNWHLLPPAKDILLLHHRPEAKHPLKHLKLCVFRISGKHYADKTFKMIRLT